MEEKFRNRRRNYYIKKEFQRNFIFKFCILVIIGSLISGVIIYAMSRSTVTTTFENSRLAIKSTADFILPSVLLSSIIVIVVTGLASIWITLFTSHRIAGPLYRIEKDVQEVAAGNLKMRFNLRQGDEIRPLAASLDTMAQALRSRIADAKDSEKELESALNKTKGALPEDVKNAAGRVRTALSKFNT